MAKAQRHKGRTLNAEVRMSDNFVPSAYVPLCLPSLASNQAECLGTIASAYRGRPLNHDEIQTALASAVFENGVVQPVFELINPRESVCLVVSDHTRKIAADLILPVLLKGLRARGCSLKDMFILFASGIHRQPTQPEIEKILGAEMAKEFSGRIYLHDPDDKQQLVSVGRIVVGRDDVSPKRRCFALLIMTTPETINKQSNCHSEVLSGAEESRRFQFEQQTEDVWINRRAVGTVGITEENKAIGTEFQCACAER